MHVYWLEQTAADMPSHDGWLSATEAFQLERLRFAKRRLDWRMGRWTAKRALAACFHRPALTEMEIRAAPSGAPEVFLGNQAAPVTISLSHRGGRAICAVAPSSTPVGCDLELIEPRSELFVADYFTVEERELLARELPSEQQRLVTLIWSAKESALKALCVGLRADTREVVVSGLDSTEPREGWRRFQVRDGSRTFDGCWQQAGQFMRTVVAPVGFQIRNINQRLSLS